MKSLGFGRCALGICAAAAMLAGCGGSQQPIGESGVTPQREPIATHAEHGKSWMQAAKALNTLSSQGALVYTSTGGITSGGGHVFVYSRARGKRVQDLTGFNAPEGLCVDATGNVFIPSITNQSTQASTIYEYAHGGTEPIASLNDSGMASGCSVDPTTGDLAVSNSYDASNPHGANFGSLAIYASASGEPKVYYSSKFGMGLCGYDNEANLYLWGYNKEKGEFIFARFAEGSGSFQVLALAAKIYRGDFDAPFNPSIQWDGKRMTISSYKGWGAPVVIYRLQITGSKAKVVGTTILQSTKNHHYGRSWIQGKQIVGITYLHGAGNIDSWAYPAGGNPGKQITNVAKVTADGYLNGIAISPGSSR